MSFLSSAAICVALAHAQRAQAVSPAVPPPTSATPSENDPATTTSPPIKQDGTAANTARAQQSNAPPNGDLSGRESDEAYLDRFWLLDPRARADRPNPDTMKLELHGEYLLRYTRTPSVPLATYGYSDFRNDLGQRQRLEHRMRFDPRFYYRDRLSVVAQFDVPHGLLLGESPDHVALDPEPMGATQPMRFSLRWLYVDIRLDVGHLRVGQQPANWGAGLVFDAGDTRQFFGDPRFGSIVERVAFQGNPFGRNSKFELLLATDWVYSDRGISWQDGDQAARAVLGASYVAGPRTRLGLLAVGERLFPHFPDANLAAIRPSETTATFDVAGETAVLVPGQSTYVVAASEVALVTGKTSIAPELLAPKDARVERFGALVRLGVVSTRGAGARRWGKWGMMFEWGWTSSDSDPSDGVDHRFISNPSRRVGLILFDEVLRWKSARAGSALEDARIGQRSIAGSSTVATAGGVGGATYLSVHWLYRPIPNLDLRAGSLLAQTTGDLVDPAGLLLSGRWTNYDGSSPTHHDLGLEFDFGTEYRQPLPNGVGLSLGAEGGVLLPGRALSDATGASLGPQGLARAKFGFYL